MYVFMTNGTFDFLQSIKNKYRRESMILIGVDDDALLLHETDGKAVFIVPQSYEVLGSVGDYSNAGVAVLNYVPVSEADYPLFEHRLNGWERLFEGHSGFAGGRFLRPLSSDTYVILTLWESEAGFEGWKQSDKYGEFNRIVEDGNDAGSPVSLFSGSAYTKKYLIVEDC
jgi:heme oxygenase (mycobilin-producing)